MSEKPIVEVQNLTARYGTQTVIEDITFSLVPGDIAMIIGPNGSGKTTLLKAMLGLIPTVAGSVTLVEHSMHLGCRDVGYVPQRFSFDQTFPITVGEFLRLAVWYEKSGAKTTEAISQSLGFVGMAAHSTKRLGELSGGQLQRILIARAILHQPKVLVLDEPASGIDVSGELSFYQLITRLQKERRMTIVMVSHDIDTVFQYATQVLCLNKKLLCFGKPQTVLTSDLFHSLYGKETILYQHGH